MPITKLIYTAQSKKFFYCRDAICEFVLTMGYVPLNPFRMFEYFLNDKIDRDIIREANNTTLTRSDQVWVFGKEISNGVFKEIILARQLKKPIAFFTIGTTAKEFHPISYDSLFPEAELLKELHGDINRFHTAIRPLEN